MEMTNFQPESRDMAIFGKSPCQKVVKLHLYCHNLYKYLYRFEKTIISYLSMPNVKSISFKMAVLQGGGGGQNLPSPCLCYPKDPMWNRVKNVKF